MLQPAMILSTPNRKEVILWISTNWEYDLLTRTRAEIFFIPSFGKMVDVVHIVIAKAPICSPGVNADRGYDADAQHQVVIVGVAVMYVSHG